VIRVSEALAELEFALLLGESVEAFNNVQLYTCISAVNEVRPEIDTAQSLNNTMWNADESLEDR
jgi:hypothetical protein